MLAFINLALACGFPGTEGSGFGTLTGQGNGQGGREHGQKADQLPGYRSIDDPAARAHVAGVWGVSPEALPGPGKSAYELLDELRHRGRRPRAVRDGLQPRWSRRRRRTNVEARLASLDLLVVADFFLSETAALADVVLPAAQWAEEDGTMTNLEGRVIRRQRAVAPPIGVRLGHRHPGRPRRAPRQRRHFAYGTPEDVFDELRRATGAARRLRGHHLREDRGAARRLLAVPVARARRHAAPLRRALRDADRAARFHPVQHEPPAEEPDADYPLFLTTGRVLAQYQSGTQTRRVAGADAMSGTAVAEIHPQTAARLKVIDGGPVAREDAPRLGRRRREGDARHPRRHRLRAVPLGRRASANRLTNPALDPTSRMPEFKVCAVRVDPVPHDSARPPGAQDLSKDTRS